MRLALYTVSFTTNRMHAWLVNLENIYQRTSVLTLATAITFCIAQPAPAKVKLGVYDFSSNYFICYAFSKKECHYPGTYYVIFRLIVSWSQCMLLLHRILTVIALLATNPAKRSQAKLVTHPVTQAVLLALDPQRQIVRRALEELICSQAIKPALLAKSMAIRTPTE